MKRILLLSLSLLAIFLHSCKDRNDINQILVDSGFTKYVNAFTSGVVSSQTNIRIVLAEPNENAKEGELLADGIIELDPSVDGQAIWLDNQTIEFRPNEKLKSGKTYTVEFQLSEIMEVGKEFETMEFAFTVIRQSLFVSVDGLKTPDVEVLETQELFGKVRTSDNASNKDIEKCLKAQQDGKDLVVQWTHGENSKVHAFKVLNIERGNKESFVELEWKGEPIGADVSEEKEVRVPPLGEFTLTQISTQRDPALHFSILLSDPINTNQDLTGLVYLRSGKKLRLTVDKNEIKAFPVKKLSSEEVVIVDKAILNILGNQLQESYERKVSFNLVNPAVELIGDGVIMPSSGNITFPFRAVNLKAVNLRVIRVYEESVPQFMQVNQLDGYDELTRVGSLVYDGVIDLVSDQAIDYGVWNNFSIDVANIVKTEPGAIYRVMISFERYQSLFPCGDNEENIKPLKKRKLNFIDGKSYFNPNNWYEGHYDWSEKDDPCSNSYYQYYDRAVSANLIASNIGMIAKESSDDTYDVIITDLRTSEPLGGVKVKALNFQNKEIGEGETNGDGIVRFETKSKPYLLIAENGDQKGYLRVDNGSALSVSLFEVGGKEIQKGIKGFIYGERGVWRPGDSMHLSFILEDKLNSLPESHPVVLELYDPKGKLYDKRVKSKGVKGMYYFKMYTEASDITGIWKAKVMVGNSSFYKSLKVETIKPNRMKIDFEMDEVISSKASVSTTLKADWLYGSPATNLRAIVEASLSNMNTTFDGYENYQFDDRSKRFYGSDPIEVSGNTNGNGQLKLNFPIKEPNSVPGMLKLKFNTKVFESGGEFSQDYLSVKYSPYRSYVGIKIEAGQNWMNALNTESENTIALAALSENGEKLSRKIKLSVYKLGWRWWWEGNGDNELTQYINSYDKSLLQTFNASIDNGKGMFALKFDKPTWGRLLIVAEDPTSGHSASQLVYADYPGWWSSDGGGTEAASMLSIESDQEAYEVGEEATLSVPSGGVGNIYVTIEKGDKIVDQFWVDAEKESTKFKVKTNKNMAPNVYVTATLVQPHAQTENSLPIRLYGVLPITVNDPNTHLNPKLKAPAEIRPESSFEFQVSEDNKKPMSYSVAVVDEGLLSLTRFKTPNPWNTFYSKEALKVRSWDMYKYVMSAKTGKMIPLLAVGGDEALNFEDEKDANRFKAVVSYLGPFHLKGGKTNTHKIDIPNYVGAVRLMVVAGHEGAYGAAEKEIKVKQPLMVLSTLPRVLGPSEKVRIPVNVISMQDKAQTVDVKVSTNDLLAVSGPSSKKVRFEKAGEKTVYFEYEVARKLGIAKFRVDVSSGSNTAFEELELSVRAPNPHISKVTTSAIESGQNWSSQYSSIGIQGSNATTFTVSRIPEMNLQKQVDYLIRYPHGCIEQTTSAAFPQLFLSKLMDLTEEQKAEIQNNVVAALNKLRNFQMSDGGLSYWPSSSRYSEWGTNYAGHFMVEAKEKGYDLPPGLYEQWLKFQKKKAADWNRDSYNEWGRYGGDLVQAYRLYTLALAGEGEIGAMNRLKNDTKLSQISAWRLAAAYAIIGRMDAAKELASGDVKIAPYRETSYTYGSNLRDLAMIIETMAYLKEMDRGAALIKELANDLKTGWHSTQTRAYSLLAISKFIGKSDGKGDISIDLKVNGKDYSINTEIPIYRIEIPKADLNSGNIKLDNKSEQLLFVSLVQSGVPVEMDQAPLMDDLFMDITYKKLDGSPLNVSKLQQGQDFKAVVSIRHPGIRNHYKEVALNQIFPSGWQIINSRLNDESAVNSKLTFQDIRDDRVYSYFDLSKNKSITIEVLLNATYCGKFYQAGVFCAPMYDESIQALEPGQWVEVVPAEGKLVQ